MSKQEINIGAAPNDGTGDPIRTAMSKTNANFTELYDAVEALSLGGIDGEVEWADITGKPAFSTVATTGAYNDLTGKPTIGSVASQNGYAVIAGGTTNQVLTKNSNADGDLKWAAPTGGISDIVNDTTPQLGGNLDLNSFTVGVATAADLTKLHALTPTSTELNYSAGVTSAIQTQINNLSSSKLSSSLYDANTILAATTDNTPAPVTIGEGSIVGRITGGNITALTATQVRTLINVENGATADQTPSEIVTGVNSAGGVNLAAINGLSTDVAGGLYTTALIDVLDLLPGQSIGPVNVGGTAFTSVTFGTAAYTDAIPVGAPTTASSSSGAITLNYVGKVVLETTTTENITSITFSNIAAYATVHWRVKQTTARNITFPAGTIMFGNGGLLNYTGVANSRVNILIYNDNGTYEVTIGDEGVVGS